MSSKLKNALLFFAIALALAVNVFGFYEGQDWGDDFSGYIIQAQTLRSGDFEGLKHHIEHTDFCLRYPWGFPVVLSPMVGFFGSSLTSIKVYLFVFFILSLLLFYQLFRHEKLYALLAILLVAASPYFWNFKNYILSDSPHLFFVMCALYMIQRTVVQRRRLLNPYIDSLLTGLAIFLSYEMRNQSIILLPALLIVQVVHYKRDLLHRNILLPVLVPYVCFVALRLIMGFSIPVPSFSYVSAYADVPFMQTVWHNLFFYTNIWVELFGGILILGHVAMAFTGVTVIFFFIGIVRHRKADMLYILLFLGSLFLVLISPFYQGLRYLVPVVPFFLYYFIAGLVETFKRLYPRYGSTVGLGAIVVLAALSLGTITRQTWQNLKKPQVMEGPYKPDAQDLFAYIDSKTAPGEIMGFWKPRAMLLFGKRDCITPLTWQDCVNRKANYYIHYSDAYGDQIPLDTLIRHPEHFNQIYDNARFRVFKVAQ